MQRMVGLSVLALIAFRVWGESAPASLLINNVTLIDGTGAAPRLHMVVRIENGRIAEIAHATDQKAQGTDGVDGTGRFLVPGFFDNNAHLTVYGQPSRRDTSAKHGDRNGADPSPSPSR